MSLAGDMEKNDAPYRDKLQYESILGFRKSVPVVKQEREREPLLGDPEKAQNYSCN